MTIPKQLGDYQLITQLAIGGYCEIWLAKQNGPFGFQRQCALKILRPQHLHDDSVRRALIAEARLVARMSHPNVISLHSFGHDPTSDYLYYSMPLVAGQTLLKVAQRGAQSPYFGLPDIVWCAIKILTGLAYVHALSDPKMGRLGIVHRDLTPENVIVSYDGQLTIIDFGIAVSAMASRDTKVHRVKGKMQYLSPEQAAGLQDLDARTDIYATGLILYRLITGQDAIASYTDVFQAIKIAQHPNIAPPHQLVDIPTGLSNVIMAMLNPNRDQRPADALRIRQEWLNALKRLNPQYTQATFETNIATLLRKDKEQDDMFMSSLAMGTQVLVLEEEEEDEPYTAELMIDDLDFITQTNLDEPTLDQPMTDAMDTSPPINRTSGTERTVPDMPAFGRMSKQHGDDKEMEQVFDALEDLFLPPSEEK